MDKSKTAMIVSLEMKRGYDSSASVILLSPPLMQGYFLSTMLDLFLYPEGMISDIQETFF